MNALLLSVVLALGVEVDTKPALEGVTPKPVLTVVDMPADKLAAGEIYINFSEAYKKAYKKRFNIVSLGDDVVTPNDIMLREVSQEAYRVVVCELFGEMSFSDYKKMTENSKDLRWLAIDSPTPKIGLKVDRAVTALVSRNLDRYFDKVR
jgi:hypothetical protein